MFHFYVHWLGKLLLSEIRQPTEYAALEDTFSAVLHRIDQAMRWRAVYPFKPIPPPYEILTRYSKPPEELQHVARSQLEKLITVADVKKGEPCMLSGSTLAGYFVIFVQSSNSVYSVPPKQKGRKRNRDLGKPMSGLDVDALLGQERPGRKKISAENAIPEFKQLLATTQDPRGIVDASRQMSEVIVSQVKHSLGDSGYGQAIEGLRVMREELTAYEEPRLYNDFIRDLKASLQAGKLDGERKEMWWLLRRNRLGLITHKESDVSEVEDEEARLVSISLYHLTS